MVSYSYVQCTVKKSKDLVGKQSYSLKIFDFINFKMRNSA